MTQPPNESAREWHRFEINLSDRKCMILSCIMVVSFLVSPFFPYGTIGSRWLMLFYTGIMAIAPYFFNRERRFLWILVLTGGVLCVIQLAGMLSILTDKEFLLQAQVWLDVITLCIEVFWVGYVLKSSILLRKLREPIFGCILSYLLLGTVFGNIYYVVNLYLPESFIYHDGTVLTHSDMIYFSFITLSTCGFGDIVPLTKFPKMIVVIETIVGVMFVALFIGRVFADYHVTNSRKKTDADGPH